MKTSTLEYQKKRSFESIRLAKADLIILIFAFLIGRTPILAGIVPLGTIFFTSSYNQNINKILLAAAVSIGMFTGGESSQAFMALAGMLLFTFFIGLNKSNKLKKRYIDSIIAAVSIFIPQIVYVFIEDFLLYDFILVLFCGVAVFFLNYIFKQAVGVIVNIGNNKILTSEEIISTSILVVLVFSGLSGIMIFDFSVSNILCILFLLIMSYKFGPAIGAATGVAVGLITNMSSNITPLVIGSYAFCGLLSGLFKKLGRVGSSLGFVLGNTMLTVYLNGSAYALDFLKELIISTGLFLVLPIKLMDDMTTSFRIKYPSMEGSLGYGIRIKEMTVKRLNKYAKTFKEMSKTFEEISDLKATIGKEDISSMFDRVADKVCKDCSLCRHCWDRNFYSTYQVLFKIIESLDSKGRISEEDIPYYFIERCERIEDFVDAVNNTFEIFKVDLVWKNKIGESRGLVSQQLYGLSKVIENLSCEIASDICFKKDLEEAILRELKNSRTVKSYKVNVYKNKSERYNVEIYHKGCAGRRVCLTSIIKQVEKVIGRKMIRETDECLYKHKDGYCGLKLIEEEPFSVITAVAKAPKAGCSVSGDNYAFMNSEDGKYCLALSDGMGAGYKAHTQSKATINLLEQFIEAGFDKDTAVRLINSLLLLKSGEDSFATIDLSVIDLYTGKVEFVKIGAVPTFIKKGSKVEVIRSASLPAGILSNLDYELFHKNIDDGAILIMMTDGVFDSFREDNNDESTLIEYIQSLDTINPQEIADSIFDLAYQRYGGVPEDDMLVVVAKMWKKTAK